MVMLAIVCNSCKKEPINSDIEGHWQLLEFTTKADNEIHPCERIYYSIQLWVVEVAEKQGPQGFYLLSAEDTSTRMKQVIAPP